MLTINRLPEFGWTLDAEDARHFDVHAARYVQQLLRLCPAHRPTALYSLPGLAAKLGVRGVLVKD
jgi:hypothetical protein